MFDEVSLIDAEMWQREREKMLRTLWYLALKGWDFLRWLKFDNVP